MHRVSSLRDALGDIRAKLKREKSSIGKLRGRYLFRAVVRRVFDYKDWIKGDSTPDDIVDDITVNVKRARSKKSEERKGLTLEDRSALLTKPSHRTKVEKVHILNLLKTLRAFKKYPDQLKQSIAAICQYQYLGPDRIIVRQGHPAHSLYYIVKGEVALTKNVTDPVTGDVTEVNVGTMGSGDMFGEIALLHSIPRTTTVTSQTPIDLFYIEKSDFDRILKNSLQQNWDILQDALVTFNYFKAWDESTIRECCILSKIMNYGRNEVLLGDGKGMVNYVYFILAGECRLIEHMIIREEKSLGGVKYSLYKPAESRQLSDERIKTSMNRKAERDERQTDEIGDEKFDEDNHLEHTELIKSSKPGSKIDHERMSVITTTLQDVVNQWHEITEVAAMLLRQPSVTSQNPFPPDVHTIFMQVCKFYRGGCFGIGEEMHNRRIVSVTPVRCLLVPRYWLLEHNRANIWERVRVFLNSKYPSGDGLFKQFLMNRQWMNYKRKLVAEIIRNGKKVPNDTTIHDVPYSIRIDEEIEHNERATGRCSRRSTIDFRGRPQGIAKKNYLFNVEKAGVERGRK